MSIEQEFCAKCGCAISMRAQAHILGDQVICSACNRKHTKSVEKEKEFAAITPPTLTVKDGVLTVSIHDYHMILRVNELTVKGPNECFGARIGQRLLAMISTPEGQQFIINETAVNRLDEVLHVRHKASSAKATERQKDYARGIGYKIADDITLDEVSFLLDDFEQVRFYLYFVFRSLTGHKPSELGIDSQEVGTLTMRFIADEKLVSQILCLQVIYNAIGEDLPNSGPIFEVIAASVKKEWPAVLSLSPFRFIRRLFGT